MLLFGDENKYNILRGVDSLLDTIHKKLDERRNKPIKEREEIFVDTINKLILLQHNTNKSLKKYYEFYKKHTHKFGEEIPPENDIEIDNYIECKKCGYREKF